MHHTLKFAACSLCVIMLLTAGCSVQRSYVDIEKKDYKSDCAQIYVEMPEFKNLSNGDFEDKLNENYEKSVKSWIYDFLNNCGTETGEECRFELKQEIKRKKAPVISVVGEAYIYTGGVHGTSSRIAKNIDIQKNTVLTLGDLFEDSSYEDALNREIQKIVDNNPEEYHDLWEKPIISGIHREFFYLSDKGLVIFYPPYELSYYARGFVEFCIPYAQIKSYLRSEYKNL